MISHCSQLASKDIKDPAWKKLQGLIWREGYANGTLSVPLYEDVAPRLKQWHDERYTLVIYSSGSVEAQKLFFRYVDPNADLSSDGQDSVSQPEAEPEVGEKRKVDASTLDIAPEAPKKSKTGSQTDVTDATESKEVKTEDLNSLFSDNFDTVNAGPKTIATSYEKIVKALNKPADECLFLSDNVKGLYNLLMIISQ